MTARKLFMRCMKSSHLQGEKYFSGRRSRRIKWIYILFCACGRKTLRGFGRVRMFSMTLICMGKLKEKFYIQASEEYKKRLGAFCDFTLLELPEVRLPENPNETQILQGLSKEAELIRAKVPKGSWLCIFAPEGKLLSSEELAGKLSELKKSGKSSVCFLIGSSFGVDAELKRQADFLLSMSRMTFPHHLARVMALEQLYRAEAIQAGTKYHK